MQRRAARFWSAIQSLRQNNSLSLFVMSDNEEFESSPIKVVDRRRFDAEGEVRDESAEPDEPSVDPAPEPASNEPFAAASESADAPAGMDFMTFVASLATNAMAAMGVLPDAEKHGMPKNRELAHEYIEILAMLQEKTKGNLDPQEEAGMQRIVAELRMAYVQTS